MFFLDDVEPIVEVDRVHGTQMVLKEYIKLLEAEEQLRKVLLRICLKI